MTAVCKRLRAIASLAPTPASMRIRLAESAQGTMLASGRGSRPPVRRTAPPTAS
jgi:hypothetical protein